MRREPKYSSRWTARPPRKKFDGHRGHSRDSPHRQSRSWRAAGLRYRPSRIDDHSRRPASPASTRSRSTMLRKASNSCLLVVCVRTRLLAKSCFQVTLVTLNVDLLAFQNSLEKMMSCRELLDNLFRRIDGGIYCPSERNLGLLEDRRDLRKSNAANDHQVHVTRGSLFRPCHRSVYESHPNSISKGVQAFLEHIPKSHCLENDSSKFADKRTVGIGPEVDPITICIATKNPTPRERVKLSLKARWSDPEMAARSLKYHERAGSINIAAKMACRVFGKRASRLIVLRILRTIQRKSLKFQEVPGVALRER